MVLSIWKQEQFEAEMSANDMYLEGKTGQIWFEKQFKLSPSWWFVLFTEI